MGRRGAGKNSASSAEAMVPNASNTVTLLLFRNRETFTSDDV